MLVGPALSLSRCGGRADAFMSVAAERGKKVCPEGGGGKRGKAELQSPSVQIDIDKYWPFIPLLSQRIMYGGNNNSSLLVDMDIILDGGGEESCLGYE